MTANRLRKFFRNPALVFELSASIDYLAEKVIPVVQKLFKNLTSGRSKAGSTPLPPVAVEAPVKTDPPIYHHLESSV